MPLSDHERRVLTEIESELAADFYSRRYARRRCKWWFATAALFGAEAAVMAVAALELMPAVAVAVLGTAIGAFLAMSVPHTWKYHQLTRLMVGTASPNLRRRRSLWKRARRLKDNRDDRS